MPSYDTQNIFAKILRGELPCHKVYEDDKVLAFLDIMPRAPGHTLVLPKSPARNLLDVDPICAWGAFACEGESLAERLTRGALASAEALQVGVQIAQALEVAHERGVVRDDDRLGDDGGGRTHRLDLSVPSSEAYRWCPAFVARGSLNSL